MTHADMAHDLAQRYEGGLLAGQPLERREAILLHVIETSPALMVEALGFALAGVQAFEALTRRQWLSN